MFLLLVSDSWFGGLHDNSLTVSTYPTFTLSNNLNFHIPVSAFLFPLRHSGKKIETGMSFKPSHISLYYLDTFSTLLDLRSLSWRCTKLYLLDIIGSIFSFLRVVHMSIGPTNSPHKIDSFYTYLFAIHCPSLSPSPNLFEIIYSYSWIDWYVNSYDPLLSDTLSLKKLYSRRWGWP